MRWASKLARILAAVGAVFVAARSSAQDTAPSPPIRWRFQLTPYIWGPGVKGTVQIQDAPELKVDVPFSETIGKFEVGLLGRFEGRKGDFGVVGDLLGLSTDATFASDQPEVSPLRSPVAVRQFYAEGIGFYRLFHTPDFERAYLDFLVGVRYFNVRAKVGSTEGASYSSTSAWLDLIGGFRGRYSLGSRIALRARGDVGGLGSKMSYNAEASLEVSVSERWAIGAGYRYQDYDFETGLGTDRRAANLTTSGPLIKAVFTY